MAKKPGFYPTNMTPSLKKIENDINSIQSSIGGAHAELINFAQLTIQKEGFLNGRNSELHGGKFPEYKQVAGANRSNKKGNKTFHSLKVVDRGGSLPSLFTQLNFSKAPLSSKTLFKAKNKGVLVKINKEGNNIITSYKFIGKWEKIIGIRENGNRKEVISTIKNGRVKNTRKGQRRIVFNGLGKALRRWKKINKFYLDNNIEKRNKVKF